MKLTLSHKRSFLPAIAIVLFVVISAGAFMFATRNASAGVSGWDAGYIMSDYVFTNKNSMKTSDIQAFLNNKVQNCDTWGEQPSEFGGGTRRQWAEARGYSPPYTCLRNYSQHGKSAAQIIYETAQEFSINPQVLLVLLQKEQSLVTDTWPLSIQYRSATGYGCPDTAPCDQEYYGFTNQVRWAARMFRAIMNNSPTWYTPYVLGNNYIQYNPNSSCGGSTVNIRNRATQALYNYTPYQPSQAALDAGWGTVSCGAYGNRNFYLYFTSWFGSTKTSRTFTSLKDPRWMQLKNDARKVDPLTGQPIDGTLSSGRHIKFTSKTTYTINGKECLRTELDTKNNQRKCILRSDVEELSLTLTPISERLVYATANTFKRDLRRGTIVNSTSLSKARQLTVSAKITVGNTDYYVSSHDVGKGVEYGLLEMRFGTASAYQDITPRRLELTENTKKVIPPSGETIGDTLPKGLQRLYDSRVLRNGQWYYRTGHDAHGNYDKAIPESKLKEIEYVAFSDPRWMQLKQNTQKSTPIAGGTTSESLSKGQKLKFVSKVNIDGTWYYRTEADTNASADKAVPASQVSDIPYESFTHPRALKLSRDARKYLPSQEQTIDPLYSQGLARKFNAKIYINGQWYYRTETDTKYNLNTAFRASDLEEAN